MLLNLNLVWAVVVRYFYDFRHSLDRLSDAFYWPAMDIFLWGFTSVFITKASGNLPQLVTVLLSGLVLWTVVWRGQVEITVNLLVEFWSQNMVNIFASPLRLREWIVGVFVISFIKMLMAVSFSALLAYVVYKANILTLSFYLIPFMISLLLTGWAFGLFISGLIVYFGQKIQAFAWSGIFLIVPFSGVYYPISVLPEWAQKVSAVLPTSYVFEGMRSIIFKNEVDLKSLLLSILLNVVFLIFGIMFFAYMFNKSKVKGLARLE